MNHLVLDKIKSHKIGKTPIVLLPLPLWEDIEDRLEELEMLRSVTLREKIAKARLEKRRYPAAHVKKLLGL